MLLLSILRRAPPRRSPYRSMRSLRTARTRRSSFSPRFFRSTESLWKRRAARSFRSFARRATFKSISTDLRNPSPRKPRPSSRTTALETENNALPKLKNASVCRKKAGIGCGLRQDFSQRRFPCARPGQGSAAHAFPLRGESFLFGAGLRRRIRKVESEEISAPSAEMPTQKPRCRRLSGAKEKSDASAGI